MSEVYSEADAYVAQLTLPLDTELGTMATMKPILTRLSDSRLYLKNRTKGAAASYRDGVGLAPTVLANFAWTYAGGPTGNALGFAQGGSPAGADKILIPIQRPHSNGLTKLSTVTISLRPANGHGGLPATQPTLAVFRQTKGASAAATLATTTLALGSVGAYEVSQHVALSTNHVVDEDSSYYVHCTGEGGANAIAGLLYTYIEALWVPS